MSKKVLSLLLIAAILLTSTLFSGVFATAETETKTWAVGDQPYAVEGKSNKIEVYNASSATFYDDFVIPSYWKFEDANVVDADTLLSKKNLQLNGKNGNPVASKNNPDTPIVWLDLSAEKDGVNENAYGGNGNSVKVTTTGTYDVKNGRTQTYYNSLRRNDPNKATSSFVCTTFPSFDDIAISFWVKTEYAAYISAAFWDTRTNDAAQKLYTDDISLPSAGEYIIVLPISSFRVNGTAYVKNEDISTFLIKNFEIMFKSTQYNDDGNADFYFDNIGVYPIKPNFKPAYISEIASVKDNFDDYTQTATKTVTSASKAGYKWESTDPVCGSVNVIDNNGDRSILYTATTYFDCTAYNKDTTKINTIKATDNNYELKNTYFVNNGSLAIHVKASKATTIRIQTNNMSYAWSAWAERQVPAGESIVRIPLSEFVNDNKVLTRMRKIIISFYSTLPSTLSGTTGTFEIDDISFEPTFVEGDTNGDKVTDICDIVKAYADLSAAPADIKAYDVYKDSVFDVNDIRMFRYNSIGRISTLPLTAVNLPDGAEESFTPATLRDATDKLWKKNENTTLTSPKNALFYRSGDNDTSAYVVDYANLKTTTGGKFYYDNSIPVPYGSDSVFGFWVYSEQSLHLKCGYIDKYFDQTQGKDVNQQFYYELDIPAGESFVTIDMEQIATSKVSHTMNYSVVYQFQINIWTNNNTENTEGTLYIDSFGFYDKDTTNDIGYTPAE